MCVEENFLIQYLEVVYERDFLLNIVCHIPENWETGHLRIGTGDPRVNDKLPRCVDL